LKDIIAIFQSYGLEGLSEDALFIPVLMLNYKIMSTLSLLKSIDTIRESDFLVFYQVSYRPTLVIFSHHPYTVGDRVTSHKKYPNCCYQRNSECGLWIQTIGWDTRKIRIGCRHPSSERR
jgi:hypothetical protein